MLLVWNAVLTVMLFSEDRSASGSEEQKGQYTSVNYTSDITDVVAEVRSSIVGVDGTEEGSGVIFGNDGRTVYIMTALSLVSGAENAEVTFDSGVSVGASLLGTDAATGLALLKTETDFSTVIFSRGNSDDVDAGEYVAAIEALDDETLRAGVGLSVAGTVGFGFVGDQSNYPASVIETDIRLSASSSGSALVNAGGQLIGIVLGGIRDGEEGHTYAVSSNEAAAVYEEILAGGAVERGILEITGMNVAGMRSYQKNQRGLALDQTEGVLVNMVFGNARDILQRDDVIIAVNGSGISSLADLRNAEYAAAPDQEMAVTVLRGGKPEEVRVIAA